MWVLGILVVVHLYIFIFEDKDIEEIDPRTESEDDE